MIQPKISRRVLLQGFGVSVSLPWLESAHLLAQNAPTPTPANQSPKRFACLFIGDGISPPHWWARGQGRDMELGHSLEPLAPFKEKINVIRGLHNLSSASATTTTATRTRTRAASTNRSSAATSSNTPTCSISISKMQEGERTVLDNSCIMFVSEHRNAHNGQHVPVVLAGGLGGTLQTGRSLDYLNAGGDRRKLCSLYLSIMDRMGLRLPEFGDAKERLAGL